MTQRKVSIDKIVNPADKQKFIHIAASPREQDIIERLSPFTTTLDELNVQVSTGPVVDFRLKNDLRERMDSGSVPLLFPQHLMGKNLMQLGFPNHHVPGYGKTRATS